jgi:hypothetical protein
MFEFWAKAFANLLEAYALVGLVFAAFFVSLGVQRLDPEAKGSGTGFRLLILPGVAAFWPMLLARWTRGVGGAAARKHCTQKRTVAGA